MQIWHCIQYTILTFYDAAAGKLDQGQAGNKLDALYHKARGRNFILKSKIVYSIQYTIRVSHNPGPQFSIKKFIPFFRRI